MNKRQKEIAQYQLDAEKVVLDRLKRQYKTALNDINRKIDILQADELTQSRIYRIEHQKALKAQVEAILEKLHSDEYSTIQEFLTASYTDAFVGVAYDLAGQGIPLIMPVDPAEAVRAIQTDSKINGTLYEALGVDTKKLKTSISSEITRGIAGGMSTNEIARNISNATRAPLSRSMTIVRTESHRIQQASCYNAQKTAISKGADVVKMWDSTMDGDTRPTHRHLDGQIREVDEPFEMDGKSAMYPGDFGDPAEDCNCRCQCLQRARWALDEKELQTLKNRAEFFGLDKTKDFADFKTKYLDATKMLTKEESSEHPVTNKNGDIILFDERMDAEEWEPSIELIKQLSDEYNTKLTNVRMYNKGENTTRAAGQVSPFGEMLLSSKKQETAVHEFAHSLSLSTQGKYGLDADSDFWKEIRKVRAEYNKHISKHPMDKISFYAADNVDEFFAEAFTQAKATKLGISIPDYYGEDLTYSNKVLEIVDKYFKKTVEKSEISGKIELDSIGFQFFANRGLAKQSDKQISKSIASWNDVIALHQDKVNNPEKYDKDWSVKSDQAKAGLIKHWKHEIKTAQDNIDEANEILRNRGRNNG